MKPVLSVIIADMNGLPEIGACLEALESQQAGGGVEVIVIEPAGCAAAPAIRSRFPWARLVQLEEPSTIPAMLYRGFESSQGEVVAILEDHETVAPGWCQGVLAAHRADPETAAIAGPIENGRTRRLVDWAAFFCEYCAFMPPVQGGMTATIPGNNVAYKRWAVEAGQPAGLKRDFWVDALHPELLRLGWRFRTEPALCVSHEKSFGFFEYIRQRYHYSRYYAGLVTRQRSSLYRMARSAACAVLPALLMKRILSCGFSKRRFQRELLLSAPLLLVFTVVWAAGEAAGSWLGPGKSLAYIR